MIVEEYFKTPVWAEMIPEWVSELNKLSDPLLNKKTTFGKSVHSNNLIFNKKFKKYRDYIGNKAYEFLDSMGHDLSKHTLIFNDLWVQDFPKDGGGHHNTHTHSNNHVTGFFFLKSSDTSSYPVFHDPRYTHVVSKLPEKNPYALTNATTEVFWKPKPGTLMFSPAYMAHQYVVQGKEDFRFLHFNIQAIPTVKENK